MLMDPEGIIPSEMSEKERQICYIITYIWNWKTESTNELKKKKQKQIHKLVITSGEREG